MRAAGHSFRNAGRFAHNSGPTFLLLEEKPLQPRLAMGLVDALLAPYPHRLYASWVHDPCRDWR
jgi:hypothetical protein